MALAELTPHTPHHAAQVSDGRPAEKQLRTDKLASARRTRHTQGQASKVPNAPRAKPGRWGAGWMVSSSPIIAFVGTGASSTIGVAILNWPVCHRPVITWPFNVSGKLMRIRRPPS